MINNEPWLSTRGRSIKIVFHSFIAEGVYDNRVDEKRGKVRSETVSRLRFISYKNDISRVITVRKGILNQS